MKPNNISPDTASKLKMTYLYGVFLLGMFLGMPAGMLAIIFCDTWPNISVRGWGLIAATLSFGLLFILSLHGRTAKALLLGGISLGALMFIVGMYWLISSMMPSSMPG